MLNVLGTTGLEVIGFQMSCDTILSQQSHKDAKSLKQLVSKVPTNITAATCDYFDKDAQSCFQSGGDEYHCCDGSSDSLAWQIFVTNLYHFQCL